MSTQPASGPPTRHATVASPWVVIERTGTAAELLGPWPEPVLRPGPVIAVCRVVGAPTVVLGSTQRHRLDPSLGGPLGPGRSGRLPEAALADHVLVVRRGGGGAVRLSEGGQVWVDVWLPRASPLATADVADTALAIGWAWATALDGLGAGRLHLHTGGHGVLAPTGAMLPLDLVGREVCFAAIGAGEVVVDAAEDGPGDASARKVVGISQWRSRDGTRAMTMAPRVWQPRTLVDVLGAAGLLPPSGVPAAAAAAAGRAIGLAELSPPVTGAGRPVRHEHDRPVPGRQAPGFSASSPGRVDGAFDTLRDVLVEAVAAELTRPPS
jgi:hypothetical protein